MKSSLVIYTLVGAFILFRCNSSSFVNENFCTKSSLLLIFWIINEFSSEIYDSLSVSVYYRQFFLHFSHDDLDTIELHAIRFIRFRSSWRRSWRNLISITHSHVLPHHAEIIRALLLLKRKIRIK